MPRVQLAEDEKFFLFGKETKVTQQNVEDHHNGLNHHLEVLDDRVEEIEIKVVQNSTLNEVESKLFAFLFENLYFNYILGTLYLQIKS